MNIQLTVAALALLTAAMLLLRIFWTHVPLRLRNSLVAASIGFVVVQVFVAATKWGTTFDRLNIIIYWLAVAGYELLVLLFSRFSPRWLTSLSALVLLIPIFAASIVLPLADLFDFSDIKKMPVGNHLFYEVRPWGNPGAGTKGVDLIISYRPPFAPFLRHKLQVIPFNDGECNSRDAIAIPSPAAKTVLGRCPSLSSDSAATVDKTLPLP